MLKISIPIILYIIFYLVSVIGTFFYFIRKSKISKDANEKLRVNKLLNEILNLPFKNLTISQAAERISRAFRKTYDIHYCTVCVKKEDYLLIKASNVDKEQLNFLQDYINKTSQMSDFNPQIKTSKKALSYITAEERKIKYSLFIPLKLDNEVVGAILIECKNKLKMKRKENEILNTICDAAALTIKNIENEKKGEQHA